AEQVGDQAVHAVLLAVLAGLEHHRADAAIVALVVARDLGERVQAAALLRELLAQRDEPRLVLHERRARLGERGLLEATALLEAELHLPRGAERVGELALLAIEVAEPRVDLAGLAVELA